MMRPAKLRCSAVPSNRWCVGTMHHAQRGAALSRRTAIAGLMDKEYTY